MSTRMEPGPRISRIAITIHLLACKDVAHKFAFEGRRVGWVDGNARSHRAVAGSIGGVSLVVDKAGVLLVGVEVVVY